MVSWGPWELRPLTMRLEHAGNGAMVDLSKIDGTRRLVSVLEAFADWPPADLGCLVKALSDVLQPGPNMVGRPNRLRPSEVAALVIRAACRLAQQGAHGAQPTRAARKGNRGAASGATGADPLTGGLTG